MFVLTVDAHAFQAQRLQVYLNPLHVKIMDRFMA